MSMNDELPALFVGYLEERHIKGKQWGPAGELHASMDGETSLYEGLPLKGEVRAWDNRPTIATPCPACRNMVREMGVAW